MDEVYAESKCEGEMWPQATMLGSPAGLKIPLEKLRRKWQATVCRASDTDDSAVEVLVLLCARMQGMTGPTAGNGEAPRPARVRTVARMSFYHFAM